MTTPVQSFQPTTATPRGENGRFLLVNCDDPNCDGALELDRQYGRGVWICNGLTHDTDGGELRACERSYAALQSEKTP